MISGTWPNTLNDVEANQGERPDEANLTLVYFESCPHWRLALENVRDALHQLGRNQTVVLCPVHDEPEAIRHGMAGSPTVLLNGRDLFSGGEAAWGCRLYPGAAGMEGAPSVHSLLEALK